MKTVLASLIMFLVFSMSSTQSHASAVASIYNGLSMQMDGYILLQDASDSNKFYWLPKEFRLATKTKQAEEDSDWVSVPDFTHTVLKRGEHEFSVYAFRVQLSAPGTRLIWTATSQLRKQVGPQAKIVGMAPVCSMSLALPSVAGSGETPKSDLRVTYGFNSDDKDDCSSAKFKNSFVIEIVVPMEVEPLMAKQIIAGDLVLPSVQLSHPYKYANKASLDVDTVEIYDQLERDSSISGSLYFVNAKVRERIDNAVNSLRGSSSLVFDIQTKDDALHERFEKILTDALANTFYKFVAAPELSSPFTPENSSTPVDKLKGMVGSKGNSQPLQVTASLSWDKARLERNKHIHLDLTDIHYGSIRSEAEVHFTGIGAEYLDKKVQDLL